GARPRRVLARAAGRAGGGRRRVRARARAARSPCRCAGAAPRTPRAGGDRQRADQAAPGQRCRAVDRGSSRRCRRARTRGGAAHRGAPPPGTRPGGTGGSRMTRAVELMTEEELGRLPREADAGFGALATARGHLPLEAMEVHARAVGLDVRTELRQTFANTLGEPIEATYIFPLPDRGAVTGFRLRVGERVVEGVIEERGAARERYDEALREGHRAAIAEEERPDVFTVRVGNLTPGQRATIELDLVGALAIERNEATFRFPLVVAPRYIPGQPLPGGSVGDGVASDTDAVPDASR